MRVLVANQPQLLRECLAVAIARKNGVEVAIAAASAAAILRSVQDFQPDCLILSLEVRQANPGICRTVLNRYPQTLILALGPKTLTAFWFDVIVRSVRTECSLRSILDVLQTDACRLENESALKSGRHHEERMPSLLQAAAPEASH